MFSEVFSEGIGVFVVSGVKSSQDALVFVMGATNRPEKLDEAVSGHGRGMGLVGTCGGWVTD